MIIEITPEFQNKLTGEISISRFLSQTGRIYRNLRDRKTLRFECANKGYFIKIHYGVGWREIFKNLSQGKLPVLGAKNEYRAIKRLKRLGISTMTFAGYGHRGWNPASLQSFLITEELADTISLEDLCRSWKTTPPLPSFKKALIKNVAEITKTLHESGINHRDLYICHFLLKTDCLDSPGPANCYLIDLHRAQIRNKAPRRWKIKDLSALYYSSLEIGLNQRDLFRFIESYSAKSLRASLIEDSNFWAGVRKKAFQLAQKPAEKKDSALNSF